MVARIPGEPGLFAEPGHRVGGVGRLVHHRDEFTAGSECPAHALEQDVIAAGSVEARIEQESGRNGRMGNEPGSCPGVAGPRFEVGGMEFYAIPHGYRNLVPHEVAAGRWSDSEGAADSVIGELPNAAPWRRRSGDRPSVSLPRSPSQDRCGSCRSAAK